MRKPLLSDFGLTEQILEKHKATYAEKGTRIRSEQTLVCVFAKGEKTVQWTVLREARKQKNRL